MSDRDQDVDLDVEVVLDSNGQRVTEERARRIAERVVSKARPGRPSLTGDEVKSPRVSIRVTPSLRADAERLAKARGTTVSALARQALEDYVGRAG